MNFTSGVIIIKPFFIVVIGVTSAVGWFLMKGVEGTDDDLYKRFKEDKKELSYDKDAMISNMLRGGGKGDLR